MALSQGHLTVVLCGQVVTNPRHVSYVAAALETAGIHVHTEAKDIADEMDGRTGM